MTVKYDHPEVERLIAEARTEVSRRRTAPRCDSCGGLIMHRSEYWIAAIADQLEAARMEIDRLGHANASLVPGAMLTATEIECLRAERDAARAELVEVREARDDANDELCRLTHHKRRDGCSIPDCRNYRPRDQEGPGAP